LVKFVALVLFSFAEIPCSLSQQSEDPDFGAAGMKGKANRAEARQSEGGSGYGAIPLF